MRRCGLWGGKRDQFGRNGPFPRLYRDFGGYGRVKQVLFGSFSVQRTTSLQAKHQKRLPNGTRFADVQVWAWLTAKYKAPKARMARGKRGRRPTPAHLALVAVPGSAPRTPPPEPQAEQEIAKDSSGEVQAEEVGDCRWRLSCGGG